MLQLPKKLGQGRPMGFLLAWLRAELEPHRNDRWGHVHLFKPSLQQRRDARAASKSIEAILAFFEIERKKYRRADGDSYDEESEPEDLPKPPTKNKKKQKSLSTTTKSVTTITTTTTTTPTNATASCYTSPAGLLDIMTKRRPGQVIVLHFA